jgi:hypothetical protein
MEYRYYYVATILGGFNIPEGANEAELASQGSMHAFICRDVDARLADLDRSNAVATMMLRGLLGQSASKDYDANLAAEIEATRESRKKQVGNSVILFVECLGDIDASIHDPISEQGDYLVCFDAVDKSTVREKHQHNVDAVKFALALESDSFCKFRTIADGLYLLNGDGKKVYSYTFSGGAADIFFSHALTPQAHDGLVSSYESVVVNSDTDRTIRLFSLMSDHKADKFRTFLFGWTALEVFVNKTFQLYHERFVNQLSGEAPTSLSAQYFERIKDVMKDKFTLADKFLVISSVLVRDGSAESDLDLFTQLKKLRNNLLHGKPIDEQVLPLDTVARLLRKYVAAHTRQTLSTGANSA